MPGCKERLFPMQAICYDCKKDFQMGQMVIVEEDGRCHCASCMTTNSPEIPIAAYPSKLFYPGNSEGPLAKAPRGWGTTNTHIPGGGGNFDPTPPRYTDDPKNSEGGEGAGPGLFLEFEGVKFPVAHPSEKSSPYDPVQKAKHYNCHPSGIECIQVVEHMNFNIGNAIKYLWRADLKEAPRQDLEKAAYYIQRELKRRGEN